MARWMQDNGRCSDPFLRAIRGRMENVRAPEGLRARIGAMLAAESLRAGREPEED